ncbi:prepilin peptidase [Candidatus Peregrinibacteria bacterium]|nr:prepilin peptidase [Candidatus Peregrinibacteria bacterium]
MYYIYTLIFIIGLAFGSFASVVIHRLHTEEKGIVFGRSKCPKCNVKLKAIDLIPIISIFSSKFECRYCNKPISIIYLLQEIVMGGMFLLTAFLVGISNIPVLIFYLLITFVFVVLSFYDFLYKEVADSIVLPAIIISFVFMGCMNIHSFTSLAMAVGIPVAFFGILFFGSKGRWLGGGDIRIGALMGALLGWPGILIGLFLGYVLGAIYSLFGLVTKKLNRKSQIPFAPFLLAAAYITMFWGKEILGWYMNMI